MQKGSSLNGGEQLLFSLKFEQNGKIIIPKNRIVHLKKQQFKLRFTLDTGKMVYVNFSQSPKLYDKIKKNQPFTNILGFGGTGMAEYSKNPEHEIILCDDAWHVWPAVYNDSDRFNRFDKITFVSNYLIGERTVEKLTFRESNKEILFSELSELYMVYCHIRNLENFEYEPVATEALKIVF